MGKWIKSLVGLKAPSAAAGKGRKWSRLWRSSSGSSSTRGGGGAGSASEAASEASSSADAFSSVVAAVVRAPPRDFRLIRQEWAAVRIQAAFRAFLARRALKALRGIVRLQALFRGRLVRREFAVTLKCMHALVRVQERARERRSRCSADGREARDSQSQDAFAGELNGGAETTKEAEEQWCDSQGSVKEVRSKIHMRREGAMKRERAIAYAISHQPLSSKYSGRPSSPASSLRNHESYIEGWMATKPWETRLMDQNLKESHPANYCEDLTFAGPKHSDAGSVRIRRNNVTTRVAARPPSVFSPSSSDFVCAEGSPSTSSATLASATSNLASEARSDSGHGGGPNYMSLTKSAKARLTGCNSQRQRSVDMPYYRRVELSSLDSLSNAGSEISVTSRRLVSMSLKGRSLTNGLGKDKENDN